MHHDHLAAVDSAFWARALMDDRMFCGGFHAGGGGDRIKVQFLNPTGSGKYVYIAYLSCAIGGSPTSTPITRYDTPITTLLTTVSNMNLGAAAPSMELRSMISSTLLLGTHILRLRSTTSASFTPIMPPDFAPAPIRLTPGMGIMIEHESSLTLASGTVYWAETPLVQA